MGYWFMEGSEILQRDENKALGHRNCLKELRLQTVIQLLDFHLSVPEELGLTAKKVCFKEMADFVEFLLSITTKNTGGKTYCHLPFATLLNDFVPSC